MRKGSRVPAAIAAAVFACASAHAAEPVQGPTSSDPSYFTPTATGWTATSLITAGDAAENNGYRLVGNGDGMGAIAGRWDANLKKYTDTTLYMTVYMDHELEADAGIERAHGQKGSFVSQWTIQLETLKVLSGEDLIRKVMTWNNTSKTFQDTTGTTLFEKLCSATLPPQAALYHAASGKGYTGRVFLSGEESGTEGRAFAHFISGAQKGTTYQLPYMGHSSWENILPRPFASPQTVVIGINDNDPGQIYVYVGTKQSTGTPVQKAGLLGGKLYGVKVVDGGPNYGNGPVFEENNGAINGRFTLVDVSSAALGTGSQLETASDASGVSQFARPEDGSWDPSDSRNFYFNVTGTPATTAKPEQSARVYRLRFDDTTWPTGGTIERIVDSASLTGKDGHFDNMTVNSVGQVLTQEDPGSTPYLAKTWRISPADPDPLASAVQVLQSNPAYFTLGSPTYHTQTEEHTGIIEVTSLLRQASWFKGGRRYYLTSMMDHCRPTQVLCPAASDPELFTGGQLNLVSGPK
jgi:hypothetical protein